MHPWHQIRIGDAIEVGFPAVIETPRDSRVQYALDLSSGLLRVRRVLFSAVQYPANYGFVPRTLAEDGEPLDALVLGQHAVCPMTILHARPIGLLRFVQAGTRDDKVLAVHVGDPLFERYRSWRELPRHQLAEIEKFFEDYRALESVGATTSGFGDAGEAVAHVRELAGRYEARQPA
ncbi:MAG: inorganic diphosphatase [Polyangiaceae bacterium]|jgi:inorganic pyrophosphatase